MPWLRLTFLAFTLMTTSAYTFRCYWMCTDETSTQQDYVEQRDRCRELAQLKTDTSATTLDDNGRKAQIASYFSECMGQNGWSVPDGKEKEKAATAAAAASAAVAGMPPVAPNPAEEKSALMRNSECNFARASADVSSIAAARAKACDLECDQALKAAPEAPRPAACTGKFKDSLAKGAEKE